MRLEVSIPDSLYTQAQKAAVSSGFDNMDAYVLDLISHDVKAGRQENYDHIFTPEVLVELDAAAAEAKNGMTYSRQQVDSYLAERKSEWLANRKR